MRKNKRKVKDTAASQPLQRKRMVKDTDANNSGHDKVSCKTQEHQEGSSQLQPAGAHRPEDKLQLRTVSAHTRSFHSMSTLTAVMLLFIKGAKRKFYLISLCHSKHWPA